MQPTDLSISQGIALGSYKLQKQIGVGGMGSVWLATHSVLGRRAAVKVLHPLYSTQPDVVTRFFNEARAATAISDPGIVQIFDFGKHTDGSAYIVMELLDGEPLDQRLDRLGSMPVVDALRIMRQVATSLAAAHAHGIVHRDLKPENIFLTRDAAVLGGERAKLLDFGIAKLGGDLAGAQTHVSAVIGTPMYMSPEQCRGAGQVDERSDLYSFGCVLFALIAGRPVFTAEGAGEMIVMHLREAPPVPSACADGIPAEVDRLILRCLEKSPAARYASATELVAAIDEVLAQIGAALSTVALASAVPTAQTTLSSSAGSAHALPVQRGRRWLGTLAAVAVAGALATLTLLPREHGERAAAPPEPVAVAAPPAPASIQPAVAWLVVTLRTWVQDHADVLVVAPAPAPKPAKPRSRRAPASPAQTDADGIPVRRW